MSLSLPNEDKCRKYAQFASHMERWEFKIIYWSMFITNLLLLFIASWIYTRGQEAQEQLADQPRKRSKRLKIYILLCMGCVAVSAAVTVMEAYALLALQFCDGEDLISLYWSTWTMIQVGSLIAMVGIILALLHSIQNRPHPPWALALGTPVLVIAGFLHLFHDLTTKRFRKIRQSTHSSQACGSVPVLSECGSTPSCSSQSSVEDTAMGEFIGFTVAGGPIVRFQSASTIEYGPHMDLLGYSDDNRPLVAYRKDSIQFISETKEAVAVQEAADLESR